jgi:hypothetical protein
VELPHEPPPTHPRLPPTAVLRPDGTADFANQSICRIIFRAHQTRPSSRPRSRRAGSRSVGVCRGGAPPAPGGGVRRLRRHLPLAAAAGMPVGAEKVGRDRPAPPLRKIMSCDSQLAFLKAATLVVSEHHAHTRRALCKQVFALRATKRGCCNCVAGLDA